MSSLDVDKFYSLCDPEMEHLCLYGHPNGTWEVNLPAEEVPPELPEPALGKILFFSLIKFWLLQCFIVCSEFLFILVVVSMNLYCVLHSMNKKRLFSLINDLPTLFEVVTGRKPIKDKPSMDLGTKSKNGVKRSMEGQTKSTPKLMEESSEDEHGDTFCGSCGGNYTNDDFWICCDVCERWYHGKCVKITPTKAESIKQYKCPSCCSKKGRQ